MARDLTRALIASPNQASTVFGVGGAHPVRMKNLFVMRFLRRIGEGADDWHNGMSFFVKSIERPAVQPQIEEINQYNRKRVVHTGVKYNPVNCTLYDTADGAAMAMWAQYASYYFGDYRQNPSAYGDDIINESMLGDSSKGYGFTIPKTSSTEPQGINSQFFFDKIEVFQVWGGEFTAYQLLNPKITNFAPDELDYEQNGISMINMSLQFEGINYENDGKPQSLTSGTTISAQVLREIFGAEFAGKVAEPIGSTPRSTSFVSSASLADQHVTDPIGAALGNSKKKAIAGASSVTEATNSTGGSLSKFGKFNFGSFDSIIDNFPSEISSLVGMRDATQAVLGKSGSVLSDVAQGIQFAARATGTSPLDQASNNNTILAGDGLSNFLAYDLPLVGDLVAAAPNTAVVTSPITQDTSGLSLSPLSLAAVNTQSDGTSQIGQRTSSQTTTQFSAVRDPSPAGRKITIFGQIKSGIVFSRSMIGNFRPSARAGSITRSIVISSLAYGRCGVGGTINRAIVIRSNIVGRTTSGIVNTTVVVRSTILGRIIIKGSLAKPIVISASMLGLMVTKGTVNKAITIATNAQGRVTNIVGTINKPIIISASISAQSKISSTIAKPVQISISARGAVVMLGTLAKPIVISSNSTGRADRRVTGALARPITISANIRALTSTATGLAAIVVTAHAEGLVVQRGAIARSITISINCQGQTAILSNRLTSDGSPRLTSDGDNRKSFGIV